MQSFPTIAPTALFLSSRSTLSSRNSPHSHTPLPGSSQSLASDPPKGRVKSNAEADCPDWICGLIDRVLPDCIADAQSLGWGAPTEQARPVSGEGRSRVGGVSKSVASTSDPPISFRSVTPRRLRRLPIKDRPLWRNAPAKPEIALPEASRCGRVAYDFLRDIAAGSWPSDARSITSRGSINARLSWTSRWFADHRVRRLRGIPRVASKCQAIDDGRDADRGGCPTTSGTRLSYTRRYSNGNNANQSWPNRACGRQYLPQAGTRGRHSGVGRLLCRLVRAVPHAQSDS